MWYRHAAVSETVAMEPRILLSFFCISSLSRCNILRIHQTRKCHHNLHFYFLHQRAAFVVVHRFVLLLIRTTRVRIFMKVHTQVYHRGVSRCLDSWAHCWHLEARPRSLYLSGSWILNSNMLDQPCLCGACHKARMTTLNVFYSPQTREIEHLLNEYALKSYNRCQHTGDWKVGAVFRRLPLLHPQCVSGYCTNFKSVF